MRKGTALRVGAALFGIITAAVLGVAGPGYAVEIFQATLSGANEVPPNGSAGTGSATVTFNANMLSVNEIFSGLTAPATASHIHCCASAGVNVGVAVPFPSFPAATTGTYTMAFDLTVAATYNTAFLSANGGTAAGAETALVAGLESDQAYVNIHDSTFPGGEIRGQLATVPEPASVALFGLGGLGLAWTRRINQRRKSRAKRCAG